MATKFTGWAPWALCLVLGLSLVMWGCPTTPADDDDASDDDDGPDPNGDEDGDGLTYEEETGGLGLDCLDPDEPDSDGDGFSDGEEYHGNFDPCDPNDTPYLGGWGRDDCYDSFASAAYNVGDIMTDHALMDQYGQMFHFRDLCDRVMYLSLGAMW